MLDLYRHFFRMENISKSFDIPSFSNNNSYNIFHSLVYHKNLNIRMNKLGRYIIEFQTLIGDSNNTN